MLKTGGKDDDEFLSAWGGTKSEFVEARSGTQAAAHGAGVRQPAGGDAADAGAGQRPLLAALGLAPSVEDASSRQASGAQGGVGQHGIGGLLAARGFGSAGMASVDQSAAHFGGGAYSVSFAAGIPDMRDFSALSIADINAPGAIGVEGAISAEGATAAVVAYAPTVTSLAEESPAAITLDVTLNKIALENLKQGTPREVWGLKTDIGDANIQGFATEISTNIGGTVDFKIATDSTHYRIEIYRMGYYGGDGARLVDVVDKQLTSAQIQPHPLVDLSLGLIDCGNWGVSASWDIPSDAVSGVYFAKLVREDGTEGENIIPFVVRDDSSHSDIVFQTSDTTWQAYNPWGGANLYSGDTPLNPNDMIAYMPPNCNCGIGAIGRAYAVSYNRPYITGTDPNFLLSGPQDYVFSAEFPAIQWLEQNGYDVTYISGVDSARSGELLLNHQVFLSVGHDEYWSAEQRDNVTAARDAGVNLVFWGGNDCYWKIQWNESIDGSGTPYRTLVCYKDTWANADINPAEGSTGTWRDERFADPGQEPENSLIGTMFTVDSWRADTISIPYEMTQLRFWRNTAVAETQQGDSAQLVQGLLGYEWNSDVDNGFRPAGLINLSLSNIAVNSYLLDYGNTVGAADATHSLTMYRDQESGALVFSAGSVFWAWGLSDQHDLPGVPVDPSVQQAMVNMFADMGVQPTTLQASLVLATQSTDHQAPVAIVVSPSAGTAFVEGQRFTITGTAQDLGGGRVAGIEVSVDGGQTWRKASGTTNWTYTWTAQASGSYEIVARATDDSLNIGSASSAVQIQVSLPSTSSLWTYADKPVVSMAYERASVELGMTFETSVAGVVTGIRFYKGTFNGGVHTGSLWTSSGTLLATGTFVDESADGWQTLIFSTPIAIQAGQLYVASYHTSGYYAADQDYFGQAYANGPLSAPVNAGTYAYGDAGSFPGQAISSNYWVDVIFTSSTTNSSPVAHDDMAEIGKNTPLLLAAAQLLANDQDPDGDFLRISAVGNASHGTVAFNGTTNVVTFTPESDFIGTASFTYTASDGRGGTSSATVTVEVKAGTVGATIFKSSDAPHSSGTLDDSVELGVKFTVSADGTITGLRFYKSALETGSHTGSLWTSTGQLLAQATFTDETASGWQTLVFTTPVAVTAGLTYVASYHANVSFVADTGYFSGDVVNGPLTALGSTASGGNGVFIYGANPAFPTSTYDASNYWVDVTFDASGEITNHNPVAGADTGYSVVAGNPLTIAIASLLANDTDPDGDALTITNVFGNSQANVSLDLVAGTVTFTPTTGFYGLAGFTYAIADGHGGTATGKVSVDVTPSNAMSSLFGASDTPQGGAVRDGSVELGVRFVATEAGVITGIRYYRSAQETGTHTGSLWTASGALLATATFTDETGSGWQTVTFATPITVTAGTTYVASYHANGSYIADSNYFTIDHANGPLTAPAGANGVYAYGGTPAFPNQSYSNSNYWVDVIFVQNDPAANHAPVANADGTFTAIAGSPVTIAFATLLANDSDADGDALTITGVGNAQNGIVSLDLPNNAIIFTPNAGHSGPASFDYSISDGKGGTASAVVSLEVAQPVAGQTIFAANDAPAQFYNDGTPLQLGMTFSADVAGTITAIRFYKAANDNDAHTANLWTSSGTLLASGTTSGETASGWQTVSLGDGIAITAGTQYVVSYGSNGAYGATGNFFTAQIDSGNLHVSADTNGLYAYGTGDIFPTSTYNKTNYYVDVIFQPLAA